MARKSRSEPRPRAGSRRERPGSPRARVFIALDLPADARRSLVEWRDATVAGRDDLRPVAAAALHVTLAFLGYRPEKEVARIADTAFGAVDVRAPPRLRPLGVTAVPARRPRLFALDLDDEGERACEVQAAVVSALAGAGLHRPEARPFWPHLTLARVKRDRRAPALEAPPPPGEPFEARELTVYRSTLRPQGALYEPLARTWLGADRT